MTQGSDPVPSVLCSRLPSVRIHARSLASMCFLSRLGFLSQVTSVDTIFLLEALLGTRFTIEEKNRIRRNLEQSKPDTIAKTKPETESFFKLLMSFPKPKPRNIEKDVKVFRWKDLELAMLKSIAKYVSCVDCFAFQS